jgi:hypothetical protein
MQAFEQNNDLPVVLDKANADAFKCMARCVIVQLNISHKTFTTRLSPKDVGWDDDHDVKKYLKDYAHLGVKKLLPPDAIRMITRVEGKARRALEKRAFKSPFGWAIPFDAVKDWMPENLKLKAEFDKVKAQIVEEYPYLVEEALHAHVEAAQVIYDLRWPGGEGAPMPRKDFVLSVIDAVRLRTPDREEVEESFGYHYHFLMIDPPEEQDSEVVKEVTKELMAREEGRKAAALLADHWRRDRERVMSGMVGSLQSKVLTTMQTAIVRACDILDNNQKLTAKSAKSLLRAIDSVESLNILDDNQVAEMARQIREMVPAEPTERQSVVRQISQMLEGFDKTLRMRMMELDIPTAERKFRVAADMPEDLFSDSGTTVARIRSRATRPDDDGDLDFELSEVAPRQLRRVAN